jgi:protein-disulfide isomerase
MSAPSRPARSTTRRERRAAERRARREAPAVQPRSSRSILGLSIGAIILGVASVLLLVLAGGGPDGSMPPVTAEGAVAPPAELRDGRSLGDPAAPVLIEAFADPQCPACGAFTAGIEPLLLGPIREGIVRYTYRDLAFLGPESVDAAAAMRAAEVLGGRFWDLHALVFANQHHENQGAFSRERLADLAVLAGLDRAAFLAGLDDPAHREGVLAESALATELGIASTPTLVVDGQVLPGVPEWTTLRAIIDAAAADAA